MVQLLVSNEQIRTAVIIAASATGYELKEKVAKQTAGPKNPSPYTADRQQLLLQGEELADELTLAEQGVRDRDRIELRLRTPENADPQQVSGYGHSSSSSAAHSSGNFGSSSLERALTSLEQVAKALDGHDVQIANRDHVHQEYFTRHLEALDSIDLGGLNDEERALVRKQRKELVKRCEASSERAKLTSGPL